MEKDPFVIENLLIAAKELLDKIQNDRDKVKITPELLADIKALSKSVQEVKECTNIFFELFDIDIEASKKAVMESPKADIYDKRLLTRAKNLEKKASEIKDELAKLAAKEKEEAPQATQGEASKETSVVKKSEKPEKVSRKRKASERRKMFKAFGRDDTWKPL